MTLTVSVHGARELERALAQLGDPAAMRRAAQKALRAAAEPIRAKAQALAPDDPGTSPSLRDSIRIAPGRKARRGRGQYGFEGAGEFAGDQVWMVIGIDQSVQPPREVARKRGNRSEGDGARRRTSSHYRDPGAAGVSVMQEFGTEKMPANPFMRPAWDAEAAATPGRIVTVLKPEIEAAARRLAKRAARKAAGR